MHELHINVHYGIFMIQGCLFFFKEVQIFFLCIMPIIYMSNHVCLFAGRALQFHIANMLARLRSIINCLM